MGRKGELPLFFHPCLQLLLFFLHDQARIYRGERGLRTYLAVALIRLDRGIRLCTCVRLRDKVSHYCFDRERLRVSV